MATASQQPVVVDSPSHGTRSSRRKPDAPSRTPGARLVIAIGNRSTAATGQRDAARPSTHEQQQQQQRQQQQQQQPAPPGQQQRRLAQQRQPQPTAGAADEDVIVIDSESDDASDDVVITSITAGQKRPRPVAVQRQQQQAQQQVRLLGGQPPMPTWDTPAVPARPPSPEPAFKCLICLEGIKADNMATTPCGHMFCFDCINDAVRATKKCPKCRKTITLKAIKRLYPN